MSQTLFQNPHFSKIKHKLDVLLINFKASCTNAFDLQFEQYKYIYIYIKNFPLIRGLELIWGLGPSVGHCLMSDWLAAYCLREFCMSWCTKPHRHLAPFGWLPLFQQCIGLTLSEVEFRVGPLCRLGTKLPASTLGQQLQCHSRRTQNFESDCPTGWGPPGIS